MQCSVHIFAGIQDETAERLAIAVAGEIESYPKEVWSDMYSFSL